MANTEKITVGLIKGRHNLPVDKYIFDNELPLPLNYWDNLCDWGIDLFNQLKNI